jgi:hypothetical protein
MTVRRPHGWASRIAQFPIAFLSGSGSTAPIAGLIAKRLAARGHDATVHSVELDSDPGLPGGCDLAVIGTPTDHPFSVDTLSDGTARCIDAAAEPGRRAGRATRCPGANATPALVRSARPCAEPGDRAETAFVAVAPGAAGLRPFCRGRLRAVAVGRTWRRARLQPSRLRLRPALRSSQPRRRRGLGPAMQDKPRLGRAFHAHAAGRDRGANHVRRRELSAGHQDFLENPAPARSSGRSCPPLLRPCGAPARDRDCPARAAPL